MGYFLSIFKNNSSEITAFNGIRATLIFLLFYGHMFTMSVRTGKMEQIPEWISFFSRNVSFILDGFFCISGFLISGPLIREISKTNTIDLKSFFIRRTLRIFPPYYFLLFLQIVLGIGLLKYAKNSSEYELIISGLKTSLFDLFYISNYFHGILPHGWSLSLEEQFYIILPFFLLYVFKNLSETQRLVMLIILYFIPLFIRIYLFNTYLIHLHGEEQINFYESNIYKPFHTHFDSLVSGILLAYFIETYKSTWVFFCNSLIISRTFYFLAWFVLISFNCLVSELEIGYINQIFRYNINSICFFIIFMFSFDNSFFMNKFFSLKLFSPIAKLSYIAYLIHMLILGILMYPLSNKPEIQIKDLLINLIPNSIIIFIVSYLLYLLTEKPFSILKEKLTNSYKKESLPGQVL